MTLPKAKTKPTLTFESANTLLFGERKIGKTTLATSIDPEHTLLLATEPGYGGLEVFAMPIGDWDDYRNAIIDLDKGGHPFKRFVVDTVDLLAQMARDAAMKELGAKHPADLEYGKGWDAVNTKLQLGIAKLATFGPVWLVSHAKEVEIKQRVGSVTKFVPTLSGGPARFVSGWVDLILYASPLDGENGTERVLRTQPTENYEAGGRGKFGELPDPLPLSADALTDALNGHKEK